jgi:hypothetical protein
MQTRLAGPSARRTAVLWAREDLVFVLMGKREIAVQESDGFAGADRAICAATMHRSRGGNLACALASAKQFHHLTKSPVCAPAPTGLFPIGAQCGYNG